MYGRERPREAIASRGRFASRSSDQGVRVVENFNDSDPVKSLKPLNDGTRIFDGDLAERAGSSLAPDRCEVRSNGRDPDATDGPDRAGLLRAGGEISAPDHERL